jgi:hypothetical protein
MDLVTLFYIIKVMEKPLLLLIQGLLLTVSTVSTLLTISLDSRVDFSVILLLLCGPLATRLKKSSMCFGSLDACVHDCEQIGHHLRLLHGDLLHNLDVADSIKKGIDDLDVLDIWDSVPGIAETFHIVLEALIMLLSDGLESLSSRWALVRVLEVSDEHSRQLAPGVDWPLR